MSKKATVFDAFVNRLMRIYNRSERRSFPALPPYMSLSELLSHLFKTLKKLVCAYPNPEKVEKYLFDRVSRL